MLAKLTLEECQAAIAAAERFPPGDGLLWLVDLNGGKRIGDCIACCTYVNNHPEEAKFG